MLPKRFVYVLESLADPGRPYVGLTTHVRERLDAHNAGRSVHTARYKPWRLVAAIEFADEAAAIRFERYLKSGSGRARDNRTYASNAELVGDKVLIGVRDLDDKGDGLRLVKLPAAITRRFEVR